MKIIKKLTSAALAVCMVFSLTAAAQTLEAVPEANAANVSADHSGEGIVEELPDCMIPWYDALGITLEQLREEMAQDSQETSSERVSISDLNENVEFSLLSSEEQSEFLGSLSPKELASLLVYDMDYKPLSPEEQAALELECPQKHTTEESREIRRRLMEMKHPDDLICSDRGEIYLDISCRDKQVPDNTNYSDETIENYDDFMISPASIIGADN